MFLIRGADRRRGAKFNISIFSTRQSYIFSLFLGPNILFLLISGLKISGRHELAKRWVLEPNRTEFLLRNVLVCLLSVSRTYLLFPTISMMPRNKLNFLIA